MVIDVVDLVDVGPSGPSSAIRFTTYVDGDPPSWAYPQNVIEPEGSTNPIEGADDQQRYLNRL